MISPSFQCDITSYSKWYHFAVQTRWYHFEKLGDITYLSRWYYFESYVISPILSKWYHLLSQLCDITLIIKWYHLVQLVISLSSKVISHNNQGDITSKARWYHILLINSKTAPHTKAPTPTAKIQKATWQHKNATKNFDYTTIAERLRTVSRSNSSHPTGVVKPVYERSTFPLTATAV